MIQDLEQSFIQPGYSGTIRIRMVTLAQIAESTGLSVSVVSRVLNPNPDENARVSAKTRRRVEEAAKALNYRPNRAAEFLKRGRVPSIGVFVRYSPNRLIVDLLRGISEAAAEEAFPVSLYFGHQSGDYRRFIKANMAQAHCGLITYPDYQSHKQASQLVEQFREAGGKMVLLNADGPVSGAPIISCDEYLGGQMAAERLLSHPCTAFATFGSYRNRVDGFRDTLRSAGFACSEFPADDASIQELMTLAAKTLTRGKLGIFAATDQEAMRLIRHCHERDFSVGSQVYLIGYDNLELSEHSDPPLTTIEQPFYELGLLAMRKLVNVIYSRPEADEKIPPKLIIRQSA